MYYYKGEKIGRFDVAYDKVFESREMTHELIAQLIDSYTEEYAKDLLQLAIFGGAPNIQTWIEEALKDMAEGWYGAYFKESGAIYERGDFAFEDWEGSE